MPRTRTVSGATLALGLTAILALWAPAKADAASAVLQGLDKITARISTFEAPIGQIVSFGTLKITVQACNKRPPEETPESAAYLRIDDQKAEGGTPPLFEGWMFASSPALSALQHAVYDIWVIDCKK